MSKKFLIIVVVVLALLAGGTFGVQQYYIRQPQYSLKCLADACKDHDIQAFRKYVAVDDIISSAVDDAIAVGMAEQQANTKNDMEQFGAAIGAGIVQFIKPRLIQEARAAIEKAVETGNFRNLQGKSSSASGSNSTSPLITLGDITKDGKIAHADININDSPSGNTIKLQVLMRDKGDYWQVASISNLKDIIAEAQRSKN